jgi:dienelactone hydrolase
MDEFGPAVDGHYDVADQTRSYLQERARRRFERRREDGDALDAPEAVEAHREHVEEWFLDAIGGLPERPDDLDVTVTASQDRDGYRVDCLTFESRPGFHVTANCYVPDGGGPHPGVLFLCGHAGAAKADPLNQRACVELVANGFVVLAADPVGQGEREQYHDPDTGERVVGGGGGVFEHCYAGQQWRYAGANVAQVFVHDARCALDALAGRADVDSDRLGVTGTSGGGLQTQYLCLVDDRPAAAAPCCSVTTREAWLRTGKRIDAEQLLPGAIPAGIDYAGVHAAVAPTPLFVGAAASDQYFPVEGVHEAVERTRRAYDSLDAAEDVTRHVADEPHCSVYELGPNVFEWFCDRLGDGEYAPCDDHAVVDVETLHATPEGSVRAAYPDERTVDDLLREYLTSRRADASSDSGSEPGVAVESAEVRHRIREQFDLDRTAADLHPRRTRTDEVDGLAVEHVWFRTERDPDIVVTGVLVTDPTATARTPAVVCLEDGTTELPDRSDDVAELAAEYGTVFVFDPRGVGAVADRPIPIPNWVDHENGIYGTEFKLAYDAVLLDDSLFGMRVFDIRRALAFLRDETGADSVALVGEGVGASHALYAAGASEDVDQVVLANLGAGFREMATSHEYAYDARLLVEDVLDCDVPLVLDALDARGVRVDR